MFGPGLGSLGSAMILTSAPTILTQGHFQQSAKMNPTILLLQLSIKAIHCGKSVQKNVAQKNIKIGYIADI